MEFEIWAVSDYYKEYDKILQKYQLKVITTKEKKFYNTMEYVQHRYITINNLKDMLDLVADLKREVIISNEGLFLTIYDDYME